MNEKFMELAIEEAKKSTEPGKCGVVIEKDGEVISKSYNTQRKDNNATAHAEIKVIKEAGNKLGKRTLENCTIYCTCEPCTMCISAMAFAKIKKLVYGATLKDAFPEARLVNIEINDFIQKFPHKLVVEREFMRDECKKELYSEK